MSSARFMLAISDSMWAFRSSNIALRLGYVDGPSAHHSMNSRMSLISIPAFFRHSMTRSASSSVSPNRRMPDARSTPGHPHSTRKSQISCAICWNQLSFAAPCQCFTFAGIWSLPRIRWLFSCGYSPAEKSAAIVIILRSRSDSCDSRDHTSPKGRRHLIRRI